MKRERLIMELEIEKWAKPSDCGMRYSIRGNVHEKGQIFGFGTPYTQEDWNKTTPEKEISETLINYNKNYKDQGYVITGKIIKDYREKQLKLSDIL